MQAILAQAGEQAGQTDWSAACYELLAFWPVFLLAFGASLILTPIMRRLALANGIVDLPDARRKAHAKPVAYLGGLAIYLGWLVGLCVFAAMLLGGEGSETFKTLIGENFSAIVFIAMGATAIVLTGLFDDIYGIRARVKIGGQLFAAAAIAQTRAVDDVVVGSFNLIGIVPNDFIIQVGGTAAIAVLVVGCCNAMNLIDGLDGLSSGVTAIAMAGMLGICILFFARQHHNPAAMTHLGIPTLIALTTIGAVAGFLPYNFNPASIFMGDTGSLLLGYLCVTTILFMGRLDTVDGVSPVIFAGATICFALPMTDTALAIVRRKLSGRPIFAPDAMHMHHMFRRSGFSVKQSVFAMYTLGLLFAGIGIGFVAFPVYWALTLTVFVILLLAILTAGVLVSRRLEAGQTAKAPGSAAASSSAPEQSPQTN